ncbi:MAG: ATPase domain-containing protein [Candidatus Jordarchaeum sp.]|uniref:ATPase domain-containing protein n=1 Tax=Candidatus Jordarchaeum sp. TaxID=2823881 RepID=UPI00404B6DC7
MLKTNIPFFDKKIKGIPEKKKVVFMVAPGIDPSLIGLHFAKVGLDNGYRIMYVVNNKFPDAVRKQAKTLGWVTDHFEKEGSFILVDAYCGYSGIDSKEKLVTNPYDNEDTRKKLSGFSTEKTVVIFDSISSFLDMHGDGVEEILELISCLQEAIVIGLFSTWTYQQDEVGKITDFFEGVFEIKPSREFLYIKQSLSIKKITWARRIPWEIPVRILLPGGLRVYIPKIVVTGAYEAGKTTFLHAVADEAISVDRMGTTVALDYGTLDYRGFYIEFFGTPGQPQFDTIVETIAKEAVGLILMVDSSDPDTFPRAKILFEKCGGYHLPSVIAANKQDLDQAIEPSMVQERLTLPLKIPVIGCSAKTKSNLTLVIDILLDIILFGGKENENG